MSVTVTENRTTYSFARTLADYDVHHSEEIEDASQYVDHRPEPEGTGQNPPDWEDNYRRVPQYRPIDHELDIQFRSTYTNNIERAFLWNMFTGIRLVSVNYTCRPNYHNGLTYRRLRTGHGELLEDGSMTRTSDGKSVGSSDLTRAGRIGVSSNVSNDIKQLHRLQLCEATSVLGTILGLSICASYEDPLTPFMCPRSSSRGLPSISIGTAGCSTYIILAHSVLDMFLQA